MAYTITLVGCSGDEIELLAMVMELRGIGMGDASKIVDHMPSVLFEGISEDSANKYKKLLESSGAILKIDETGGSQSSAPDPDPFSFPEPDFGNVVNATSNVAGAPKVNVSSATSYVAPEPVQVREPQVSVAPTIAQPEVNVAPTPVQEPAPAPEPTPVKQSVVEIAREPEQIIEQPSKAPASAQTQTQQAVDNTTSIERDSDEEPKYKYYGYCPKCGSSFVSVKKVGGLFGSNKVRCVCEVCKHKF